VGSGGEEFLVVAGKLGTGLGLAGEKNQKMY
jgi:hypothetical protein